MLNIPDSLPKCKLVSELVLKANQKTDAPFEYISKLNDLREIVSQEVSQINELFPEYTPHDELYHLKRLFYVADEFLGKELIESLNVSELFLLSVSLYGHDWGMAVSEEEKNLIISGQNSSDSIELINEEKNIFVNYCESRKINPPEITIDDWREYVRQTHARRSAVRMQKFFKNTCGATSEFAPRVCEGHYLDYEYLDDNVQYPTDCAMHREVVNLKAITIYLRIIDLLDLGEDRTPFLLWKFVSPRNELSAMEWAKHRCLRPISVPSFVHSRHIQVDGSTDDHNVYMAILDFKKYVDSQFRQGSDMLNRLNHAYHRIDISHIDWRISPRGFEPIPIQFEFNRSRMFEILSDEIYQSNPYVFLRELLQNSIDAIKIRKSLLDKLEISFVPKISVSVQNEENYIIVKVADNGIGMDEYIIRNYLSVVGKSYYKSDDFYNSGFNINPISRFGVGVLSCFMVSDKLEFTTYKDPNSTPVQEHFKVSIPARHNYFRIEKNKERFNIGTVFTVPVSKELLRNIIGNEDITLDFETYIRRTFGFSEFPIEMSIDGRYSIHKSAVDSISASKWPETQIEYKYPREDSFFHQNLKDLDDFFEERKISIREDLKLDNHDGCISIFLPKEEDHDIVEGGNTYPSTDVFIVSMDNKERRLGRVQWDVMWDWRHGNSSSWKLNLKRSFQVYLDGILLEDIARPVIKVEDGVSEFWSSLLYSNYSESKFICPYLVINIPKPKDIKLDLARTNFKSEVSWDNQLWESYAAFLKKIKVESIDIADPKKTLFQVGKFITYYHATSRLLLEFVLENNEIVIPLFSEEGYSFEFFNKNYHSELILLPKIQPSHVFNPVESYFKDFNCSDLKDLWKGGVVVTMKRSHYYGEDQLASVTNGIGIATAFIYKNFYLHTISIRKGPNSICESLALEVYRLKTRSLNEPKIDFDSFKDIQKLDEEDLNGVSLLLKEKLRDFPYVVRFPKPFDDKFAFSNFYLNVLNDFAAYLVWISLKIIVQKEKSKSDNNIDKGVIGEIYDLLIAMEFLNDSYLEWSISEENLNSQLNGLIDSIASKAAFPLGKIMNYKIKYDDFVKGSLSPESYNGQAGVYFGGRLFMGQRKNIEFGMEI